MGFEEDYRQGHRNKVWGKAMKAFVIGKPDDQVGRLLKTAVCEAVREMGRSCGEANIRALMARYGSVYCEANSLARNSLFPCSKSKQEVSDKFKNFVSELTSGQADSKLLQDLVNVGLNHLEDTIDRSIPNTSSQNATKNMLIAYLSDMTEQYMQPAMYVAVEKSRKSPSSEKSRLGRAIALIPLDRIANEMVKGKIEKLSIRTSRPSVKQMAEQSLL